ncbi:lantibiotic dehydratase C-terminal domain-containing protein [Arthrobacter sp. G119Y2]|uniref:lantibiotic dehydratase C-terminal domain-containing protein n=1 Tax=Arthrobacter sp. G119Y2 TaxID=3134965 RepID=UPI00311A1F82
MTTDLYKPEPESLQETLASESAYRWVAYHIYYGGMPNVLLSECLIPLVESLIERGLVRDYFYINYWLEGSHVRLRLRVPRSVDSASVDAAVIVPVQEYLKRRPSMHPMVELTEYGFYEQLFVGEFTEADRPRFFDADGNPVFMANNSIHRRPYEREIFRYGGEQCMLLAERHFVASTSMAVKVMQRGNQDVRTLLLGIATQLSFVTACAFLRDRELVRDFFVAYHQRWISGYAEGTEYTTEGGQSMHASSVANLRLKMLPLLPAIADNELAGMPQLLRDWAETNLRVRSDLEQLYAEGVLQFDYQDERRSPESIEAAAWSLCHSLIHMTNNRMMVSVADEAFIAFQISQAMETTT